jgi:putative flippase GtrA
MKSKYQFIIFALNGIVGLVVDLIVLFYTSIYLNLYISRFISFLSAVIITWILNRNLTFKQESQLKIDSLSRYKNLLNEFKQYFFAVLIGGIINLSTYYCYIYINFDPLDKYIATVLGSLAGLISNFIFLKFIVFKRKN